MTELQHTFLHLVRLGIGTETQGTQSLAGGGSGSVDWTAIKAMADEQGLSAVVLDGVNRLSESAVQGPPRIEKLQWIGEVQYAYEARYPQYENAIATLAGFYNRHGLRMMVLKGYACSLDWPKPNHRPCGDIDIWQFGEYKEADLLLNTEKGIRTDNSHHHHTVFDWQGFAVENHYDFVNVHQNRTNAKIEKIFKKLGEDDARCVVLHGERVYMPSPNLHALFLLKHAALHFVNTELTFRQVLDWAFFVEKHGKEVDWAWLLPVVDGHGMTPFLNIMDAICAEELGFDVRLFPAVQSDPAVKNRVVDEIFASVYEGDEPGNVLQRQISRYRRWKGNAWKHKLCYKESMWSAFWSGVWAHLMKPKTI